MKQVYKRQLTANNSLLIFDDTVYVAQDEVLDKQYYDTIFSVPK